MGWGGGSGAGVSREMPTKNFGNLAHFFVSITTNLLSFAFPKSEFLSTLSIFRDIVGRLMVTSKNGNLKLSIRKVIFIIHTLQIIQYGKCGVRVWVSMCIECHFSSWNYSLKYSNRGNNVFLGMIIEFLKLEGAYLVHLRCNIFFKFRSKF